MRGSIPNHKGDFMDPEHFEEFVKIINEQNRLLESLGKATE